MSLIAFSRAGDNGSGDGETVIEERPTVATDMPKPTFVSLSENSTILSTADDYNGEEDSSEESSEEEDDQLQEAEEWSDEWFDVK